MKVTDKNFYMEDFLIEKLDLYIERACKNRKLDIVVIVDGDEGFGKTGLSILCAYYISQKTGRKFDINNIFFDPQEFINKINTTKEQILIWDEAALGGLAAGWASKVQQMLVQTLMTCRFRKHIIFFNCPKFYRLNNYFVSDRAWGLMHVYSRDGISAGRMIYYRKDALEGMIDYYSRRRRKPYKAFGKGNLHGSFVDAFNLNIIDEDEYDKRKEETTQRLLTKFGSSRHNKENLKLKYGIYTLQGLQGKEKAKHFKVRPATITEWGKIPDKYPEIYKPVEQIA
jgi:hypothetical protein